MTTKSRLLIVEDNKIAAQVLKNYCQKAGFTVDQASGATAAMMLLLKRNYCAILMDLGLEDGDGKSLIEWIRAGASNLNQSTPIIVVSAHIDQVLKIACIAAGANEVLVKPVSRATIDGLLKRISKEVR